MVSVVRLAAGRVSTALGQVAHQAPKPLHLLSLPRLAGVAPSQCSLTTSSFSPASFTLRSLSSSLLPSSSLFSSFSASSAVPVTTSLLQTAKRLGPVIATQTRCYHVRVSLKRRCAGCYFVRRKGRLFVECKLKPRHKQMQVMAKRKTWKEDYSEGNIKRAIYWKYNSDQQYYKLGDNQYARHDWLKGKIGVTV